MIKLSDASKNTLLQIIMNGGSLELKGNKPSGNALAKRGLIKIKQGRMHITAKGRRWFDKN